MLKINSNNIRQSSKGFTLIELVVVVIIVGVLSAIALPSYYSWILLSRTSEALVNLSQYEVNADECLNTHVGAESTCDTLTFASTPNFTYQWDSAPVSTPGSAAGSAATPSIEALPSFAVGFNFPGEDTAYAYPAGGPTNYILESRSSHGIWTCAGDGVFVNVC